MPAANPFRGDGKPAQRPRDRAGEVDGQQEGDAERQHEHLEDVEAQGSQTAIDGGAARGEHQYAEHLLEALHGDGDRQHHVVAVAGAQPDRRFARQRGARLIVVIDARRQDFAVARQVIAPGQPVDDEVIDRVGDLGERSGRGPEGRQRFNDDLAARRAEHAAVGDDLA